MGAWGEENFENDDAGDWICGFTNTMTLETLMEPIKAIVSNDQYLESPDCCYALAAAEVVAAAASGDLTTLPQEAKNWLSQKPNIERAQIVNAEQAVRAILDRSELRELWEETEDFQKWQEVQQRLITKLNHAANAGN